MKFSILSLLALLIVGCSNTAPIGQTPIKSAPVAPIAERVRVQTVTIRESNTTIQQGLSSAIDQLERVSKQKEVSDKDFNDLWDKFTGVQKLVNKQWEDIQTLEKTNSEMSIAATAADIEKQELRTTAENALAWQAKNAKKVAVYDWITQKAWIILAITAVVGIGYLALKFFLPFKI
jgi:hypothetical protein